MSYPPLLPDDKRTVSKSVIPPRGQYSAGRTGSLVAATLAKHGVHTLSLIDPDVLELHNLDAMDVVTKRDLGRYKVDAIAEHLQYDLSHTHITTLSQSVMDGAARVMIKTAEVLVCCVDDDTARLVTGALACCYAKPLLDIGTGVFADDSDGRSPADDLGLGHGPRRMGADIRLLLPGDGCMLCWGGVANLHEAFQGWRMAMSPGSGGKAPRRHWQDERAGSLRSLGIGEQRNRKLA